MSNSVKKPVTPPVRTFDERHAAALEALNGPAQLLAQYRTIYETTNDPSIPLAVLCTAVEAAGDAENVTLPAWAGRLLAVGFAQYLDAIAAGDRTVSLEQCLGIKTAGKDNIADLTTLDEMAERVQWYRWQFGLKAGIACHIVYRLHVDQCSGIGLQPDKVGITRSEKSFQQHYDRHHAGHYQAWKAAREANGETPTNESRERALSMLTDKLAKRVTVEAKKAKIPA
jgi:hypothetical protein